MDKIVLSLDEFLSLSPDEIKRMAEENAKLDSNGRYSDETSAVDSNLKNKTHIGSN